MIFGVMVAKLALRYDALSIAVCPDMMVGVVVVNEHDEGALSMTCKMPVQTACS